MKSSTVLKQNDKQVNQHWDEWVRSRLNAGLTISRLQEIVSELLLVQKDKALIITQNKSAAIERHLHRHKNS